MNYLIVLYENKLLQSDIDKKNNQSYISYSDQAWIENLESQIRDTSIFEQFEFLKSVPKVSEGTDDWGEQIDFSVEEILDMPTLCEVQPDLTKNGSVTDSNLQILSQEEAWELFA